MNKKALRQRWRDQPELARAAVDWLADPTTTRPAGLETIDGRIDLRCLPAFPADRRQFDAIVWDHVDLSSADLTGLWLNSGQIADSSLVGADLRRTKLLDVTIANSDLAAADFRQATVGNSVTGDWPTLTDVDLTNANISGVTWVGVTITRCTFERTKLKKTTFGRCLITDTTFATDLTEVEFHGSRTPVAKINPFRDLEAVPMRGVDFAKSRFDDTVFRNCAVESIKWPDDPNVRVITDPVTRIGKAIEWLNGTGAKNNINAGKDLQRLLDDAGTLLPDGQPFVVVELGFWQKPLFKADVEEALFGAGQAPPGG